MILEEEIRLTAMAACAGCAAKINPETLSQLLQPFSGHIDPRLIVGLQTSDDAAVYRLSDTLAVIQTVDFFTPIVDDPWTFGAIAATNSMSDVYAMGGEVRFALNVAAFPEEMSRSTIATIFEGGAAKVAEAGAVVAGGHTITTAEPLFGMSVMGEAHPDRIWTKAGARPGDCLFLTKPIGTGVLTTSLKNQDADPDSLDGAVASMTTLNRAAAAFAREQTVHACTDITGYSLAGHSHEVAAKSGVAIELSASRIPLLHGAEDAVGRNHVPGGLMRNQRYFTSQGVHIDARVAPNLATLMFDPQTSGGLLFAIPVDAAGRFVNGASNEGIPCWEVGRVTAGAGVRIVP
jgi:selenide,water dikinase